MYLKTIKCTYLWYGIALERARCTNLTSANASSGMFCIPALYNVRAVIGFKQSKRNNSTSCLCTPNCSLSENCDINNSNEDQPSLLQNCVTIPNK